jgi:hypothetical protein
MLIRRMVNSGLNAEPIAHGSNLAEGDTGLRHPEWAGIHSEEQDPLAAISVATQLHRVRAPGVDERVVNVRDWRGESQFGNSIA